MLVAMVLAIASGHPSAAKRPFFHKLDTALKGRDRNVIWGESLIQ
jgi:hypothetical protein